MSLLVDFVDIGPGMIDAVGGKALNLGVLSRAGLPVPAGYCLTTTAYRSVVGDQLDDLYDRLTSADPEALARANKRFHHQIHLASHNRYLVQQLDLVHRSMALMARTSLAAEGRGETALAEHKRIIDAIAAGDGAAADKALRQHISMAWETRLKLEAAAAELAAFHSVATQLHVLGEARGAVEG